MTSSLSTNPETKANPALARRGIASHSLSARRRRVLIFDHTATLGGGEIALLNLVGQLKKSPYDIEVLLGSDGPLVERLTQIGVTPFILPLDSSIVQTRKDTLGPRSLLRARQIFLVAAYARRLAQFLLAHRIDLLHTNSLKSDIIGALAGRLAGVPVLWHVRDRICPEYLPGPVVRAFRLLARFLPSAIVANSESTLATLPFRRERFIAHDGVSSLPHLIPGKSKLTSVVYSGVHDLPPLPKVNLLFGETATIGMVGRISRWKGQHIFLRAAAEVLKQFPLTRFQIVGSPLFNEQSYEREILDLTRTLGIEHAVEFTGFRADADALVSRMDIVVHASIIGEPFGQVVIEAMAAAKPVIATRGGGVPEIVQHDQTGLLVPMDDAPAMAAAMLSLLQNPAHAFVLGRAARQRVADHFLIDHTAQRILTVYNSLIAPRL